MNKLLPLFIIFSYIISASAIECVQKISQHGLKAVVKPDSFWPNGTTLNIYFINGSIDQKNFVIENSTEWTKFANLTFSFNLNSVPQEDADIVISFEENGNYSNIGIDALPLARSRKTTMNLEVVRNLTTERDRDIAKRTVQHEFGHVLGFVHEHQSPYRSIKINHGMAERLCSSIGWSVKECEDNIFHQFNLNETMATGFDFKSVMLYPMKRTVYSGWIINDNWQLSETDKIMAALIYPGRMGITTNKTILKIDRIKESHKPFGRFLKTKEVKDINGNIIEKSFDRFKTITLGYIPPEGLRAVSLKAHLAATNKKKDVSIEVSANGDFIKTVVIPKDSPNKTAIEFAISEFNLQNVHSGNESTITFSTDSDFLIIGVELEVEIYGRQLIL